jgi:hypothetical protein
VALGASPELLTTLDLMKKLQEDIADRLKTFEESHVDSQVPVAASTHGSSLQREECQT